MAQAEEPKQSLTRLTPPNKFVADSVAAVLSWLPPSRAVYRK